MNDPTGPNWDKGQSPKIESAEGLYIKQQKAYAEHDASFDEYYSFGWVDPRNSPVVFYNIDKQTGEKRLCRESEQVSSKSKASRLHKVFRLKLLAIVQALIVLTERK